MIQKILNWFCRLPMIGHEVEDAPDLPDVAIRGKPGWFYVYGRCKRCGVVTRSISAPPE